MYGVARVVVTARQRDSLSSQQAARRPAERHVMPSRPAVTVHTGWQRSTTHTDVDARVALPPAGQLSRACTRTSLRLGCDGLHRGHRRCPATAHSSTVTNCLGQLWLGGGCAETHLRGRRVGPAGRSAMRTVAGAATVPPWTACCHSIWPSRRASARWSACPRATSRRRRVDPAPDPHLAGKLVGCSRCSARQVRAEARAPEQTDCHPAAPSGEAAFPGEATHPGQ
eukprot:COSAG06_NODE_122_length_23062_cov_43.568990_5_plen_226_part_00